jgi:hypothetical protein
MVARSDALHPALRTAPLVGTVINEMFQALAGVTLEHCLRFDLGVVALEAVVVVPRRHMHRTHIYFQAGAQPPTQRSELQVSQKVPRVAALMTKRGRCYGCAGQTHC